MMALCAGSLLILYMFTGRLLPWRDRFVIQIICTWLLSDKTNKGG